MQLKQDWKPTRAGMWSQADRLNPSKGRLLSCLSESWHFWVLFVLLVITPCPSMLCCMSPGGVTSRGLFVSSFLSHPCFPVHAWAWKLLHGDWWCQFIFAQDCCWMTWVLKKPQLVLHFLCICTGWEWGGGGKVWCVCLCVVFNLKWRSWDLLRGFPASCFSVWHNLPIYPLPTPKGNRKLCLCVSEATSCLNRKDHGGHPVCAFKTRWWWGALIPLVFSCLCRVIGIQNKPHIWK